MKKNILIILAIAACFGIQYMITKQKRELLEGPSQRPAGMAEGSWNAEKAEEDIKKAEPLFSKAVIQLKNREISKSTSTLYRGHSIVSVLLQRNGDKDLSTGETVQEWYERSTELYLDIFPDVFHEKLAELGEGKATVAEVRQIVTDMKHLNFGVAEKIYEAESEQIASLRARLAPKWIRVILPYTDPEYNKLIKNTLDNKLTEDYGFDIVYGYAMDTIEKRATWKTIKIRSELKNAFYELQGRHRDRHISVPRIPEQLKLTFKLEGTENVPTTWDNLQPIQVQVKVPESILLKPEYRGGGAEAEKAVRDAEMGLIEKVSKELAQIPQFRLFPEFDPTTPLVKDGLLDMNAARAMGYLNRSQLLRNLKDLASDDNPLVLKQVCILAISLNIEQMASTVSKVLPTLKYPHIGKVLEELQKTPWYGEYRPIVALIDNLDPNNNSSYLYSMLRGQLTNKPLKKAVLRQIENGASTQRRNFVMIYLQEVPLEEAAQKAAEWLTDQNGDFAALVFNEYAKRDAKNACELALKIYNSSPGRVFSWLRIGRYFNPTKYEKGWTIVREALKRDEQTKRWAFELARRYLQQSEGWDIIKEILDKKLLKHTNEEYMRGRLVNNVRQAHPEQAKAYLLDSLKSEIPRVRETAAGQLLAGDENKTPYLKEIIVTSSAHLEHKRFIPEVINGIHRNFSKKGWDFSEQNHYLKAIFISGSRQENENCRRTTFKLWARLIKKGNSHFRTDFDRALGEEPVEKIRREAQKLLQ